MFLALTVRFLTKRYIGEYDHQAGKFLIRKRAIKIKIESEPRKLTVKSGTIKN